MRSFTKSSLELLRSRIDLAEVLSPYVELKKSGAYYKACCPFHDEKTPSFVIQAGDSHYHCFGCGAHGDAISFLMNNQKMTFQESVELLADKFSIHLETSENESKGPNKKVLKDALNEAKRFYHFYLLKTKHGTGALKYLYDRGMDLDYIKTFQIGLSPNSNIFQKYMFEKKVPKEILYQVGLIRNVEQSRDFFGDRIMIPISDAMGACIGFSARKYKEDTFGGKYINTPETVLFKKSKVLFGLNFSRRNIAKQRKAIVVEGQLDCLRLIYHGFTYAVASQGTAFTVDHVKDLVHLGINEVYLAFDSDTAGIEAAIKTGDLFQKEAIETFVLDIPPNMDPDSILINYGPKYFEKLLKESKDYLSFLVSHYSKKSNMNSPAKKNEIIQKIVKSIKNWDHPLMVHESLRKLAKLTKTPESIISPEGEFQSNIYIKKESNLSYIDVNPDLIMETDLLRILFLHGSSNKKLNDIAKDNLDQKYFKIRVCKNLFTKYLNAILEDKTKDLLSIAIDLENAEERLFLSEMLQKKINLDRIEENFIKIVQQLLDRYWMEKREEIKLKIHSSKCSDEEVLELAKEFDEIKNNRPEIILSKN